MKRLVLPLHVTLLGIETYYTHHYSYGSNTLHVTLLGIETIRIRSLGLAGYLYM